MKSLIKRTKAFRFRHYCRGKYAVFNSLHLEVTIGHLATYIADRQWCKTVSTIALMLVMVPGQAKAQSDDNDAERLLPAVRIVIATDTMPGTPEPAVILTAEDFQNTTIHSIGDLLSRIPSIDLRTRGVNDVQGDLSMRGGTFDQMVILLNGINLTDAQTGHHTLDIPIDISMVERIELLSPSQLLTYGISAFCGGINILVAEEYRDQIIAEISAGSYGTAKASLMATKQMGKWAVTLAGSYNRSDGYISNTDYKYGSFLTQAARHSNHDDWFLQVGGQIKNFGSHAFYSISYPDQYEATRTLTATAMNVHRWRGGRLETSLYSRIHRDRFELFRDGYVEAPSWYSGHNHHLASVSGLRSRGVKQVGIGEVVAGVEVRREGIASNVLGNSTDSPITLLGHEYPKSAARIGTNLFGGYRIAHNHWKIDASILGLYHSQFGFNYGLSSDISYKFSKSTLIRGGVSRTYRLPTFTDLYYQSVNQVANPDLNSESSLASELEFRHTGKLFSFTAITYFRNGSNIIDWVRKPSEDIWYSMNHTSVNAFGIECIGSYSFNENVQKATTLNSIGVSYAFCQMSQDAGEYISGSALEYLKHKALAWLIFNPLQHFSIKIDIGYRLREGQYVDGSGNVCNYGSAVLLNARAEYEFPRIVLYVEGHNLTDTHYRDHGGIPQPGITLIGGAKIKID